MNVNENNWMHGRRAAPRFLIVTAISHAKGALIIRRDAGEERCSWKLTAVNERASERSAQCTYGRRYAQKGLFVGAARRMQGIF